MNEIFQIKDFVSQTFDVQFVVTKTFVLKSH